MTTRTTCVRWASPLVVAPWNFPLAILTGMTSAALVAGNPVIVKPAGPTPVIGAQLARILHAAGAPPGTINYLPSPGGTVGELLVRHPDVEVIAFTGSKDVGLHIIEEAADHPSRRGIKRVIAEMGGKNALIVDSDADLDVAVLEAVVSAFALPGAEVLGRLARHRARGRLRRVPHALRRCGALGRRRPA